MISLSFSHSLVKVSRLVEKDLRCLSICARLDIENGTWTQTMPSVPAASLRGRMDAGIEEAVEEGSLWVA